MTDTVLRVGDLVDVTTGRLAYGGEAVARHDGLAIFIPLAAPGERLRVRITERKKNFARAAIEQIIEPASERRQPPCRHFGECGGCQLQHMTYEAQLAAKVGFVRDALERIGRLDWPHEIAMRHANEFGYRGRAKVKIDPKSRTVGFNRQSSNRVCDIESCPILAPEVDAAFGSLRSAVAAATDKELAGMKQVEMAAGEFGVSFGPALGDLPGGDLQRTVRGAVYGFGPSTFFQSNPGLLDVLMDEALSVDSGDFAIDLYAGVGFFSVHLARRFKRVIGVEADSQTAQHGLFNIARNNLDNVEFHTSQVEAWLRTFITTARQSPDLIMLDPPRSGAGQAIPFIIELNPARISYISCDPATLARDLRTLVDAGYKLVRVAAIDLFPQTYHIETVALLNR